MRRPARVLALAGLLAGTTPVPAQVPGQQPAPAPNGAITGTVMDGSTGEPVAGALVFLSTADGRRPIPGVQTRQMTDEKGRFAFVGLTGDSTFTLAASKFGYLAGGYGRDATPEDPLRPVLVGTDEWVSNIRVPIWTPGSISGAVRDEAGDPVVGVFVRALVRIRIAGRDDVAAGPVTITDDRGEYRLSNLPPGRYLVQVPSVQAAVPTATQFPTSSTSSPEGVLDIDETNRLVIGRYPLPPPPMNGRQMAYPFTFHPSTSIVAEAMTIEVRYGQHVPNIDLTLTPLPAARVSGVVEGPPEALTALTLRLMPAGLENLGLGSEAATALVGADGRFTFLNVPAGSYTIDAPVKVSELTVSSGAGFARGLEFPVPPPSQGWGRSTDSIDVIPGLHFSNTSFRGSPAEYSGRTPVTVGPSDVTGVVVRLLPHASLSGRVVVESDPAQPTVKPPPRFPIVLDTAGAQAHLGRPQRSFLTEGPPDEFSITGIAPGQYWLRASGYPAWIVKSVTLRGRDVSRTPLDIAPGDNLPGIVVTVTNATPALSGAVRDSGDLKAGAAMVVAFPTDPAEWRNVGFWPARLKTATVSSNGTYALRSLPAGDYYVAAIERSRLATWRDPEYLSRLAARSGIRVTLSWGTATSQDLTAMVVR